MKQRPIDIVIVTDEHGDMDWQTSSNDRAHVNVVHIDFRNNLEDLFPDDIETLARQVQSMSKDIPWRVALLGKLKQAHQVAIEEIEGGVSDEADVGENSQHPC